jgi:hypothetical protein
VLVVITKTQETANSVKGVECGHELGNDAPHTRESVFIKRRRRRRLDLKTLNGTLRESARVYRELAEGRISMAEAEVRSRVLRRHGEIMSDIEQRELLVSLNDQLAQLRAMRGEGAVITPVPALPRSTEEL